MRLWKKILNETHVCVPPMRLKIKVLQQFWHADTPGHNSTRSIFTWQKNSTSHTDEKCQKKFRFPAWEKNNNDSEKIDPKKSSATQNVPRDSSAPGSGSIPITAAAAHRAIGRGSAAPVPAAPASGSGSVAATAVVIAATAAASTTTPGAAAAAHLNTDPEKESGHLWIRTHPQRQKRSSRMKKNQISLLLDNSFFLFN